MCYLLHRAGDDPPLAVGLGGTRHGVGLSCARLAETQDRTWWEQHNSINVNLQSGPVSQGRDREIYSAQTHRHSLHFILIDANILNQTINIILQLSGKHFALLVCLC